MCAWIVPPGAAVIEPAPAPEIFITGVGAIERIGDLVRFYCVAEQRTIGCDQANQVVVVKIVRPLTGMTDTVIQMLQCLAERRPPPIVDAPPTQPTRPHLVS